MIKIRTHKKKHPMNLVGLGLSISLIPAGTLCLQDDVEITARLGGLLFILNFGRSRYVLRVAI